MDELTLDQLISKLQDARSHFGHGNIAVYADVNMGEYEVTFEGMTILDERRCVMLWDSSYSDYAPHRD
jgi:hypothetical protein